MDTKKLRQKILDLAIKGKLVPQDPNDEPASVLLEHIRAEREQLVKEGKIKKSKTSSESHYQKFEPPFEIPESWEWVRLGEINLYESASINPAKEPNVSYSLYSVPSYSNKTPEVLKGREIGSSKQSVIPLDVLLCKINPHINRVWVIPEAAAANIIASSEWIIIRDKFLNSSYLRYFLSSPYFREALQSNVSGVGGSLMRAQTNFVNGYYIAIPPLKEQSIIANKVKELFNIVDIIEDHSSKLTTALELAKSKVLSLAIQGKLVPQDPNDEPAIELLKRINPDFTPCDTRHYADLPSSWCEVPLGTICKLEDGAILHQKHLPYFDVKSLRNSSYNYKENGKYVQSGTTLILVDGENSGEVFIAPMDGYQGSTMKIMNINHQMDKQYVLLFISMYREFLHDNKVGSAIPHLNKKMFKELVIPIPPVDEQRRIVNQIARFDEYISSIQKHLN